MDVALPRNGSKTRSPGSENALTKNSTRARGKGAECEPWLDSDFISITFDGRAKPLKWPLSLLPSRPAADPRAPLPSRPLPDADFGLSGEYAKQSAEAWPTASGRNLIRASGRVKWNTGSQAFLKRLVQPPGTPLSVLRQHHSSRNHQPHSRTCEIKLGR